MSLKWTLNVHGASFSTVSIGIVEHRQVVAGIQADAEVFAAVALQQRDLLIDAPVLVVLDAERHLVALDDRQRRFDLLVESGDGALPVVERRHQLVAAAEQADDAQACRAGFLRHLHRVLELIGVGPRQEGLDLEIHVQFFLHPAGATRPVEGDVGHAAVRAGGADLRGELHQPIGAHDALRHG